MRRISNRITYSIVIATVVALFSVGTGIPSVNAAAVDPLFDQQWGLFAIGAPQVWNLSTGVGVTVAIIDSGTGPHPDLEANLNPGRSIIDGVESVGAGDVDLVEGHGTHVAGIVAAINGNGIGVSGVAPNARIIPYRSLEADGSGKASDVAIAVRLAVDAGAKVINLSLGGDTESIPLRDAIQYAVDKGALIVAAAGNHKEFAPPSWPAKDDNTIAVTAIDQSNNVASFDQRGEYIDLSAPGVNIISTKMSKFNCLPNIPEPAGYGCLHGTSMAAAFVSGAAALLFAARPNITAAQVRALLITSATDLGPVGRDTTFGVGLVNLPAAFAALEIMFPTVINPMITTTGKVGSVASAAIPTRSVSPKLQWYRCTRQGVVSTTPPLDCTPIINAVALTYQMTAKDLRGFLRFAVTSTAGGITTTLLSATSPKIIGMWLKVDAVIPGAKYTFGQLIASPSKGVRSVKVLAGACIVKNLNLVMRPKATGCRIKMSVAAKAPFPQLSFTATIRSAP